MFSIICVLAVASSGPATGQQTNQGDSTFIKQRAKEKAKVNKIEALAVKQKAAAQFNPKEISVDRSVPWQKASKNSSRHMKSRSKHVLD
jgi:hypothetical protein